MKKSFLLSNILSVSALSAVPLVSCGTSGTIFLSNSNDTVNIKFSKTVGAGHTFEGEPTADTDKDYRCRFVSALYEIEDGLSLPTHRQLKTKNLEVVRGGKNIISSCSLQNNVLIIPAAELTGDITINLLGAEISDWISWDLIQDISNQDVLSSESEAKKYFEVGDYKALYTNHTYFADATIIGFDCVNFVTDDGTTKKSPFSFEIFEPKDEQKWGPVSQGTLGFEVPRWEEEECKLWQYGWDMGEKRKFGFTPRKVNLNSTYLDNEQHYSYFYVLSMKDMVGENPDSDHLTISGSSGSYAYPTDKSSSATYHYYRTNEYKSIKSVVDRVSRSQDRWVRYVRAYIPYTGRQDDVTFMLEEDSPGRSRWFTGGEDDYACWVFCL